MFDERKARRVTGFIECLRHTKGEFHGKPFKLLPWQEKIIRDVFGTVRDDDPTMRQYTTAYIEIPKKQGKSELGAAIALNMLANDNEWKAEVYSCASDRQQAAIVFDVAVDMVKQSPALSKRIKIIPSMKRMVYQPTGSIYQVLSSEVATKHGLNVSACIFDELHTQPTRALYDVMTQGSGDARKQPLWFFLTTAGTDRNSICWEVHQKALDVLEGRKIDPRFYPVIFGLPDDADWTSETNWYKANPSLGHTITIDKVRDAMVDTLDRRDIPAGHHLSAICTVGKLIQHDAVFAKLLINQSWVGIGQVANGLATQQGQLPCCGGSHIQQVGYGQRPYLFLILCVGDDGDCVGLFHVAAELSKDLRKADADGNGESGFAFHGFADFLCDLKANSLHIVREGKLYPVLVHAEGLDDFRVTLVDTPHDSRILQVQIVMRVYHDQAWARLLCLPVGHARLHSAALGGVAGCQHDAMSVLRRATNRYLLSFELGLLVHLHAGIKAVQVAVQDYAHPSSLLRHGVRFPNGAVPYAGRIA